MMRNAVSTGLVDFVLRAEEIPAKLAAYFGRIDGGRHREGMASDPKNYIRPIVTLLRAHTGHDFSNYKEQTIARRVRHRMHVLQMDEVSAFLDRLRQDSREVTLLFQDLLIGVTNFFRDPEAFAALEHEVIPHLFEGKGADHTVRVWVPGCATGEEAYSIAILLRECASKTRGAPKLQLFASDIDEHALNVARLGRYPATIAKDIPAPRLERHFLREDGSYRIATDLREICLFSLHNLLRDPPFSKLDLISCRNLLIYLNGELQDQVIPLFHYALEQNGFLFLGTSENVTRHTRLFSTVDKSQRIFKRRSLVERALPHFPLTAPNEARQRLLRRPPSAIEPTLKLTSDRLVLDRFAPAHVVINSEGDLLQSSGRTGKYLELPSGTPPDTNIFSMARLGLRPDLRTALQRAITSGRAVKRPNVMIGTTGGEQEIDLYVHPFRLTPQSELIYLVVFQDIGGIQTLIDPEAIIPDGGDESRINQLEAELRASRERVETIAEELEASNEELKSRNEELQSMNEELQSTNEELETSKEEMQSVNEELQTVNTELHIRVAELSRANNDIANLLESTQIATVFLDRALVVKSFTPAAKDLFPLVESDAGRPIMDVRQQFECETFQADAERVLRTLEPVNRQVKSTEQDRRYIMRILPYRTADNAIGGVVITFTDITRISAAESRIEELTGDLRTRIDELETILDLIPIGIMITGSENPSQMMINSYGARLLGADLRHKGLKPISLSFRLFENDQELARDSYPFERAAHRGEAVIDWQGSLHSAAGHSTPVLISAMPLFANDGVVRGAVAAIVDMSRHRQAEDQQRYLLAELQHRVKNILATIASLATRLADGRRVESFNEAFLSRLEAMSRTHDLLASGNWSGITLRSLVETALEPYATAEKKNIVLGGPEIRMRPNAATTLGMIFHELATNASKYGALSSAHGRVEASWTMPAAEPGNQHSVQLTWAEHGGPPVDETRPAGFGTSFITRGVEYELAGSASVELVRPGLRCSITFPVAGNVEEMPLEKG